MASISDNSAADSQLKLWIPFASDGHGDYLCLDLAPATFGKKGQIISFSHESGKRRLVAESFGEWLRDLADELGKK